MSLDKYFKQINTRIARLSSIESPNLKGRDNLISLFTNKIGDFLAIYAGLTKLQYDRSLLIEAQVRSHCFEGELHDNYHKSGIQIPSTINNLISSSKQVSNLVVQFIDIYISKNDKREIRTKSFGSFLNSIKLNDNPRLEKLKTLMNSKGNYIENSINDYRDKCVEHIKYSENKLFFGTDGEKNIFGKIREPSNKEVKNSNLDYTPPNDVIEQKIVLPDGKLKGYIFFIHVAFEPGIQQLPYGTRVKKGTPIMRYYFHDKAHLKKYGYHSHAINSPGLNKKYVYNSFFSKNFKPIFSPSSHNVVKKYAIFIRDFLDCVIEYANQDREGR